MNSQTNSYFYKLISKREKISFDKKLGKTTDFKFSNHLKEETQPKLKKKKRKKKN
jgi:hypothetical protein